LGLLALCFPRGVSQRHLSHRILDGSHLVPNAHGHKARARRSTLSSCTVRLTSGRRRRFGLYPVVHPETAPFHPKNQEIGSRSSRPERCGGLVKRTPSLNSCCLGARRASSFRKRARRTERSGSRNKCTSHVGPAIRSVVFGVLCWDRGLSRKLLGRVH
jgi:hypothetical protein